MCNQVAGGTLAVNGFVLKSLPEPTEDATPKGSQGIQNSNSVNEIKMR